MATEFVHLHNHSEYSMLDGACRIADMVEWAVENSVPAVALTDHGNMFGAWELYSKAKKAGVNPIVGCEVYVAPGSRKTRGKGQGGPYHLTLLAEDATGYQNLLKLVSLGYTEGFYSKPRIDMEILREYRDGIIALTGCIQGQVPQLLSSNRQEEGIQNFKTLMEIMGQRNLYVEVQNHYIEKELEAYPVMTRLAKEFNLPIVGTNDCHYLRKSDHSMHDVLLCIQMRRTINDQDRMRFDNHFYFKSVDEMREALKNYPPEAITNTLEIANRCNLELDYGKSLMPEYEVPEGHTNDTYLKELCYQGLREKYGEISEPVRQRLDYELDIISKTDYSGYFLVVWDYVKYAHKQGYPLSARGSAASSLVLYALDVITFNPMDYDCLFERFLNLERISPPDIDIDFADRAREHVISYLREKYGEDSVGKVATFATLGAKAAITDVGRALEKPIEDVRTLTQLIPTKPGITLDEVLEQVPDFRTLAERPENRELIDLSKAVEGMKRHVSCHASAIVVSNGPLTDYVPLFKDRHDQVAAQFDGKIVEDVGIVKFDSLGVRSLTEIYDCLQMIKATKGEDIKLEEDIPFDDEKTYALLSRGLIAGLFQLETSPGMYRVVTQMRPDNFEEFSTIPALYRPGPLESGTMQDFIDRKNRLKPVKYIHPSLEDALKNTYGVCVYQEQVMQIARDMAGFTLGEADILRSAMGKKNPELLRAQRQKFIDGAVKNGIAKQEAEDVFTQLEPFAGYAFNKSHTVAYSMLAYRMAYLKTHYPHEFMAAMMTGEAGNSAKITRYRAECKKLADFLDVEINLLPPDVNSSRREFTVDGNDICFGLVAVKGVGDGAIDAIVDARAQGGSFSSLENFCERVDIKQVSKRVVESLILSGAFDSLEGHRARHIVNLENIMKAAQTAQAERERGQMNLFDETIEVPPITPTLTDAPEYDPLERLKHEKEQLGFYVSGHPLEEYTDIIEYYTTAGTQTLIAHPIDSEVFVAGMITEVKNLTTRKGDPMAVIGFEDLEGSVEIVVFPEAYKTAGDLVEGRVVWIRGKVNQNSRNRRSDDEAQREERQIQADHIVDIESVREKQTSALEVTILETDLENTEKLEALQKIARANRGQNDLILRLMTPRYGEVIARCAQKYNVAYRPQVIREVEQLFGENCIKPSNRTMRGSKNRTSHMDFV